MQIELNILKSEKTNGTKQNETYVNREASISNSFMPDDIYSEIVKLRFQNRSLIVDNNDLKITLDWSHEQNENNNDLHNELGGNHTNTQILISNN